MKAVIVGLGSMGYGMGLSLLKGGVETLGIDFAAEREEAFRAAGGSATPRAEALAAADAVVIVVVNAAQSDSVLFGEDGVAKTLKPGCVVINCPTVSPAYAQETEARLSEKGLLYLDAPISGGSVKAAAGKLTIMASGRPEAFAAARPALDAMAETVFELGDAAGAGAAMKVINQLLAGIHIAAAAEAITFGMTQGVDPAKTVEVISKCAGSSWMFENRGPHIVAGDYTPHSAVDIFVKDLGIVSDIARSARFSAPLAATALQQFLAASGAGHGREDDAAVAKIYARNAGLTLPGEE